MTDLRAYEFPELTFSFEGFDPATPVLDLGGGGEGVIGQAVGSGVIAIDRRMDELHEAADGPVKVVMDALHLGFPAASFPTLTAFFTLMYISEIEEQAQAFAEAARVLQPGGVLHIWDVTLPTPPPEDTDYFVVNLGYEIGGKETGTGYGVGWPEGSRDAAHYIRLAEQAGLRCVHSEALDHCYYLQFKKIATSAFGSVARTK
jgi:ubiquinone/menaquinone biosynthesis C-methylase UbiE